MTDETIEGIDGRASDDVVDFQTYLSTTGREGPPELTFHADDPEGDGSNHD